MNPAKMIPSITAQVLAWQVSALTSNIQHIIWLHIVTARGSSCQTSSARQLRGLVNEDVFFMFTMVRHIASQKNKAIKFMAKAEAQQRLDDHNPG